MTDESKMSAYTRFFVIFLLILISNKEVDTASTKLNVVYYLTMGKDTFILFVEVLAGRYKHGR